MRLRTRKGIRNGRGLALRVYSELSVGKRIKNTEFISNKFDIPPEKVYQIMNQIRKRKLPLWKIKEGYLVKGVTPDEAQECITMVCKQGYGYFKNAIPIIPASIKLAGGEITKLINNTGSEIKQLTQIKGE